VRHKSGRIKILVSDSMIRLRQYRTDRRQWFLCVDRGGQTINGGEHAGGPRRNPHRHTAWSAKGTSSGARLHQHRGERHEIRASCLSQREAMAISFNDIALDRGGDAGSSQRLPPTEGTQTTSSVTCHSGSTSHESLNSRRPCSPSRRPRNVNLGNDRSAMFNKRRDIPRETEKWGKVVKFSG
jgi:hypothetical protein